jgi:hypothetical protein
MGNNKILHKKNIYESSVPLTSDLILGELAINTFDGRIFLRSETSTLTSVKTFLNSDDLPFSYNESVSGVIPKDGGNTITEVFANVLGGYNNDVSGAGSTVVNGEDNDIAGDFSIIGSGLNNKIGIDGDYSFNASGQNNYINHSNVYTLGSNLSSHANNFTYVNNLSATGSIYANGIEITGGGGGSGADTEVRSLTSNWESTYTTVQSNSANWDSAYSTAGADLAMRSLSANWESTYTTVQSNSASWSNIIDLAFKSAYTTYYHELNYDSITTDLSSVQIYEDNTKATHLFEKLLTYTSTSLLTGISITDKVNNNTLTKTLSYDGNDNLISTTRIYT